MYIKKIVIINYKILELPLIQTTMKIILITTLKKGPKE